MYLVNSKGVDISDNNGAVNLEAVKKAGYEFVMIRCGFGSDIESQDDLRFEENVKKAEALGMPWGAYFYTYSLNAEQDKSELSHILRLLKGKKPTMPIAIDVEDADGYKKKHGGWNCNNVNRNTQYLLKGLRDAGYYPMLYTGFEEIENYIDKDVWQNVDLWFAHWAKKCGYTGDNLSIWQYGGETNLIDGNSIKGVGVIDKNLCLRDYPTIIKAGGYNGWSKDSGEKTISATVTLRYLAKTGYNNAPEQVMTVQRLLKSMGCKGKDGKALTVDGIFGENTDFAVKAFQKKKSVTADGIVGTATWKKLLGT